MKKLFLLFLLTGLLILPGAVLADDISPSTFSAALDVGDSVTLTKTVTVSTAPPTSAKVDVLFLVDTTSSMAAEINAAKLYASGILSSVADLGDVAFGVAQYEDFPVTPFGGTTESTGTDIEFAVLQNLTTDTTVAQAGINALQLGWGSDLPEANLYALAQAADPANIGWRADSTRIIVWMGDAPGHDGTQEVLEPTNSSGIPIGTTPYSDLSTVGVPEAIAALQAEGIVVAGINFGTATQNLDVGRTLIVNPSDTYTIIDLSGQATAITDATGGSLITGSLDGSSGDSIIIDLITDAIYDVFAEYGEVTLDISDVPGGLSVTVTPTAYTGDYDRSEERTFEFEVTFTGLSEGFYDFEIRALVDRGIVATEFDRINVGSAPVPEPATMLLLGTGLVGLAGLRRRMKK